ncbi:hypothetical protein D3C81_1654930 [compost metagenome]
MPGASQRAVAAQLNSASRRVVPAVMFQLTGGVTATGAVLPDAGPNGDRGAVLLPAWDFPATAPGDTETCRVAGSVATV